MKKLFMNLSISMKSMIIFSLVLIAVAFMLFFILLPKFYDIMLLQKKVAMKYNIEMIFNLINEYEERHLKGEFTLEESQKRALQRIKTMKYQNGNNYFWVNDLQPKMIMHPTNSDLNGKDLSDYKDPNGTKLFVNMVDLVKKETEGTVEYKWKKPNSTEVSDKVSYVRLFKPWGWIVGTGIWSNDVDPQIKSELDYIYLETYIGITGLFILVLVLATLFGNYLRKRLNLVNSIADYIAEGNFNAVDSLFDNSKLKK